MHLTCHNFTVSSIIFLSAMMLSLILFTEASSQDIGAPAAPRHLNIEQCLDEAWRNNRRRPASKYKIEMAEAQHRQVLAGYWPQLSAKAGYKRTDEPLNFLYPAGSMDVGFGPIPLPEQEITLMDEDTLQVSLEVQWLLYDGGMRKGYSEQALGQVEMMKQESRRTDLQIVDSVKRLYWGAVLARRLHQVGQDTLARMEATLRLTEAMYKAGSGKVKKTDWLTNKIMVETIRSMVAVLEKNEKISGAALANIMGMSWDATVIPTDTEIAFMPFHDNLAGLVGGAYALNPDWGKIEAGFHAAEGALRTAKSGHYPKVAVTGELHKWTNDFDGGLVTDENKDGWSVGIGIEIPIFSGGLIQGHVAEAKARIARIKEEKVLLKEGIGVQIRNAFLSIDAAEKSYNASLEALDASEENRKLNIRAYQHGLAETEDVVNAQLMEAMMAAQYYKVSYDHVVMKSQLNLLVGTEIIKRIQ
ncbi:MAG: TolC family protein [Desulfotalea sp.]